MGTEHICNLVLHQNSGFRANKTGLSPTLVFLLLVPRRLFCSSSTLFVYLCFHIWHLCVPCWFLGSPSFDAFGGGVCVWGWGVVLRDCKISWVSSLIFIFFLFAFLYINSVLKMSLIWKRKKERKKQVTPFGIKFFFVRVDLSQKKTKSILP